MKSGKQSSSVDRAFELIGVVAEAGSGGVSLSELAARSEIAISTCHRYVTSLLGSAVLEKDDAGKLHLGIGLISLAGRYLEEDLLRTVARPYLSELVEVSGETAHLGVPLGGLIVYVDKVESSKSVRLVSRIGSRVPMHCTSMGKAVLAQLPEAERAETLALPMEVRTPRTRVGADLLAELERVRVRGYAIDDEENEEGVRCIGVAITSTSGTPIGALSISAPANRFGLEDCERLAPRAIEVARTIGRRIG